MCYLPPIKGTRKLHWFQCIHHIPTLQNNIFQSPSPGADVHPHRSFGSSVLLQPPKRGRMGVMPWVLKKQDFQAITVAFLLKIPQIGFRGPRWVFYSLFTQNKCPGLWQNVVRKNSGLQQRNVVSKKHQDLKVESYLLSYCEPYCFGTQGCQFSDPCNTCNAIFWFFGVYRRIHPFNQIKLWQVVHWHDDMMYFSQLSHEKKPSYFPINPGWLLGILMSWFSITPI